MQGEATKSKISTTNFSLIQVILVLISSLNGWITGSMVRTTSLYPYMIQGPSLMIETGLNVYNVKKIGKRWVVRSEKPQKSLYFLISLTILNFLIGFISYFINVNVYPSSPVAFGIIYNVYSKPN